MAKLSAPLVAAVEQEMADPRFMATASSIIKENLADYLSAILMTMFPEPVSGVKEVIRRLLFVISQDGPNSCRGKYLDSTVVVAELKKIHPFNPDSMYDAICRIAQPWNVNPPLIRIGGKVGTYGGEDAASERYTKMITTPETEAIFFRGVNLKALPMMIGKSGQVEPKYFVPALPTALLYANYSIGFGYQSKTVSLGLDAVCDLAALYARHMSETPHLPFDCAKYAERFIPDFATPNVITNYDELLAEYRRGNFKAPIRMDGIVKITGEKIIIRTLPHGERFASLMETITGDEKDQKKPGVYQKGSVYDKKISSVVSLSSPENNMAELVITLRRTANAFDVWDDLQQLFSIQGSYHPNPNYFLPTSGEMAELSYSNLLSIWYTARKSLILSTKRKAQQSLIRQLYLAEAQYIVVDHMDEVVTIIRKNSSSDARVRLCERFKITPDQARALIEQKLEILSKTSGAELLEQIRSLKEKISVLGESFGRIGEEIAETALKIKKDFGRPRSTHIPNYIGCAYVDGGFIQFEKLDELSDITRDFPRGPLVVSVYDGPYREGVTLGGTRSKDLHVHKYGRGKILSFRYDPLARGVYSVAIVDGGVAYLDGTVMDNAANCYQVRQHCMSVTRKGVIERINVKEAFTLRKSVTKGSKSDVILVYPESTKPYYLVTLNSTEKNIVHIQKLAPDADKAVFSPVGDIAIFHAVSPKDCVINIDPMYTSRIATRVIRIHNLDKLLGDKTQIKIDLGTNKIKNDPNVLYI